MARMISELQPLLTSARQQLKIDRIDVRDPFGTSRAFAWLVIGVIFSLGWAYPTMHAIEVLSGAPIPRATTSGASLAIVISLVCVGLSLLVVFAYTNAGTRTRSLSIRQRLVLTAKTLCVSYLGVQIGWFAVTTLARVPTWEIRSAQEAAEGAQLLDQITTAMAGPAGELALVVVPVMLLRATNYGWATVAVTAVVLRVPFHLYDGWAALGLTVWALLAVALYRRTGSILGPILAHAAHNVMTNYPDGAIVMRGVLCYSAVGVVAWTLWRASRTTEVTTGQVESRAG